MSIKSFKAALMSTLVLASLLAPLLALMGTAEAQATYDNILRGAATAYNINQVGNPPWKSYEKGSLPPIMVAQRVGTGGAVAAGIAPTCRNTRWDGTTNPYPHLDKLLDAAFQWMKSGATKVLWFQGYGVYNDTTQCSELVSALDNLGYTVTGNATTPITSSLLAPYDIVVIPQLQLGSNGGDPDLLDNSSVQAIVGFVQGGGGCLIMDGSDFGGHDFPNVQNKILLALGFTMGFQDDQMSDDNPWGGATYNPIVDVNVTTPIGTSYQSATGGDTKIGVYSVCTMAPMVPGVGVKVVPDFQAGMPGETIQYSVKVFNPYNPGAVDSTYNLTVTDNAGWSPTISPTSLFVKVNENNKEATLSITIPNGENLGTEDTLVVTAVKSDNADVKDNFVCVAHAGKGVGPVDDTYVSDQDNTANYGDLTHLNVGRYNQYWQYIYLKFDLLGEIPDGANITNARLYLFCYYPYGPAIETTCSRVADDSWSELSITWNNKPAPGAALDTESVGIGETNAPPSYSWDVTSFVKNEFAGDKLVSLVLTPPDTLGESNNRGFESKEWPYENRVHPLLSIDYTENRENQHGVSVSISPSSQSGSNGVVLTYTVTVKNTGVGYTDTYTLASTDNAGWTKSLSKTSVGPLSPDASDTVTLSVTIPGTAINSTSDSITVTATCQADVTVSNSASCVAIVGGVTEKGVQVSISPTSNSGNGKLDFTVTVTNTGSSTDTFALTATDTKGWGPTLSITSTTLAENASRTGIRLSITIPNTAANGDSTTMTIKAAGTGYDNSATCTATATGGGGGTSMLLYVGVAVVVIVIIAVVIIVLR